MQTRCPLTPQMMNHIQVADLGEEAAHRLAVFLPVFDCSRPV